ncbi:MAG: (deoxy)nucleoside triphosphate pyrophosphohydrolase [Opitutales bacterium]|nr:(deoxy)nucleoside triphosphate pyrophosphohydrolase [Opitutales bacterium]MCH8540836.1 (deoxy)nucleoside triphosphate pyrophosphohydrolase [Opitutales bacterium]
MLPGPNIIPVACLVLIDSEGNLLATQRGEGKALPGLWEFPGGKIEKGETPETALRRECLEELHLPLGELQPLPKASHPYPFGTVILHPFLAKCQTRPALTLTEHLASCWIPLHEWPNLGWAPADIPVLEELVEGRDRWFVLKMLFDNQLVKRQWPLG